MKFQISMSDVTGQFGCKANTVIAAGQDWEDVCKAMEGSEDASIDYALDALKDNGEYQFHNADGDLVKVLNSRLAPIA